MEVDGETHLAISYNCVNNHPDTGDFLSFWKSRVCELGIVSDSVEAYVINDVGRKHDIHIDFYSVGTKLEGLKRAKKEDHPDGTRYLFVGDSRRDRVVAEEAGWRYMDFEELLEIEGEER